MNAFQHCFQGHISARDMQTYIAQDNMDVAIDVDGLCHLTPHVPIPDDISSDMFTISAWQNSGLSQDPVTSPYYKPTLEEMSQVISGHLDSVSSFIKADQEKQNVEPQTND